jgi:hypothetical protein
LPRPNIHLCSFDILSLKSGSGGQAYAGGAAMDEKKKTQQRKKVPRSAALEGDRK